jgi:O-antigen ligase
MLLFFLLDNADKIKRFENALIYGSLLLSLAGILSVGINGIPREGVKLHFGTHVPYGLHIAWAVPIVACRFISTGHYKYLTCFFIMSLGLYIAESRGVILSLFLGGVFMYFIFGLKTITLKIWAIILTSLAFASVLVYMLSIDQDFLYEVSSGRTMLYTAGWEMFKDSPLLGAGWGAYQFNWSDHVTVLLFSDVEGIEDLAFVPHNSYLMILSQLGSLGLLIYLILNYLTVQTVVSNINYLELRPYLWLLIFYYIFGLFDNHAYGDERFFYIICGLCGAIIFIKKARYENKVNKF